MKTAEIIKNFLQSKGSKFVYLNGYTNKQGEISNYCILIGAFLSNKYQKDIQKLEYLKHKHHYTGIKLEAWKQLYNSIQETLKTGSNSKDKLADYFTHHIDNNIKYAVDSNNNYKYYLNGAVISKTVIKAVEHKKVNSKQLTIEKNKINKLLRRSKIRNFELNTNNIKSISINNQKLIINL